MALNVTGRAPENAAVVTPGSCTLSVDYNVTGGYFIYRHQIYWKVGSGTWQVSTASGQTWSGVCGFTRAISVGPSESVEWYIVVYYIDAGGVYRIGTFETWNVYGAPDTTAPTITSITPAMGNVAPGGNGIVFGATLADDYQFQTGSLYVDGVLEETWLAAGAKSVTKKLSLGAHTYRWTAEDEAGNTTDTGTINITVINGAPVVATGAVMTVAGSTGAVSVANLGSVRVSWTPFADGNPEDDLTYTLEERVAGGSWAQYATGLTSPATYWTPDLGLGAVELRVKANDGTADSGYLTRTGITVLSSQSPTAPTITDVGGNTWREGEEHDLGWSASTHPESLPITYRLEFSALGDFTDAALIAEGIVGTSYAWSLPTTLVASNTATCKVRVRAEDEYAKVSAWSTSTALTVNENATPTIAYEDPVQDSLTDGNTPLLVFLVDDADSDALHMELLLSVRPDFVGAITADSSIDQTGWEESADGEVWTDVPDGGATAGNYVRWQSPALRYDYYYLEARVTDGLLTSEWTTTITFLVTPSGAAPLTCTIGTTAYYIENLKAYEKTGGEPSPIEFDISLDAYRADPVVAGASVSIGLSLEGLSRVWNGTVEKKPQVGAKVHIYCLQDDAVLSRKLVPSNYVSADLGANLKAMVDDHGAPLDSAEMDTTLGIDAAITGDDKTLCAHLQEWQPIAGYLDWVDSSGTIHLVVLDDLPDPEFILYEGYE